MDSKSSLNMAVIYQNITSIHIKKKEEKYGIGVKQVEGGAAVTEL